MFMKKYVRALTVTFLMLALMLGASVAVFGEDADTGFKDTDYARERATGLDARVFDHYGGKSDAYSNAVIEKTQNVLLDFEDELKRAATKAEPTPELYRVKIDLLYEKGLAAGILSWIYYSNVGALDPSSADAVWTVYASKMAALTYGVPTDTSYVGELSAETIANMNSIDFFTVADADGKTRIEQYYTELLWSIYNERIDSILAEGDSETVKVIIKAAKDNLGSECSYDAIYSDGENGGNYKAYLSRTESNVRTQRNRDRISAELAAVLSKTHSAEHFETSLLLKDIRISLANTTSVSEMNELLRLGVHRLIDSVRGEESGHGYRIAYLDSLKLLVSARIAMANSAAAVSAATVSDIFDSYALRLSAADAKDALLLYAERLSADGGYSDAQRRELFGIVDRFNEAGGELDRASDISAVEERLFAAKTGCLWFDIYKKSLDGIEGYIGSGSEIADRARVLYDATAVLIFRGERYGGDDMLENLKEDIDSLSLLVTEAEAECFKADHNVIIEKTEVAIEDKTLINSAILDSVGLSDSAERMLSGILADIGEKYKAVISMEIASHVTDEAENMRRETADKLIALVSDITAVAPDGSIDLSALRSSADIYLSKSETVKALYDIYCGVYLSGMTEKFSDEAEAKAKDGAESIINSPIGRENDILSVTRIALLQLATLENIYATASGYEDIEDVAIILEGAKTDISECNTDDGIAAFYGEITARLTDIICGIEKNKAEDSTNNSAEALRAMIEGYVYINEEQRNTLLDELYMLTEEWAASVESATDGESVKEALALFDIRIAELSEKAGRAELDACLLHVKNALSASCGAKEDYSEENYLRISEIMGELEGRLAEASTVDEYIGIMNEGISEIEAVENILEEAERVGAEKLTKLYEELLVRRVCYSAEALEQLREIYEHSLEELRGFTLVSDASTVYALTEERMTLMRGIRLDKIYTDDGLLADGNESRYPEGYDTKTDGYIGALWAEGGIPSDARLDLTVLPVEKTAELINKAAKKKLVLSSGESVKRDILKKLRSCDVTLGFDIALGDVLPAGGKYRVSLLLPDGTDMSNIIGVVLVGADGAVEFFETTPSSSLIEFETSHFSSFYIVSEGKVDLVPLIVCLSIIVLCEVLAVSVLLIRRRKKAGEALCGILPVPFALATVYRPKGGYTAVILLGAAAVMLGALIGYLAYLEIRDAKRSKKQISAIPEKKKASAVVPISVAQTTVSLEQNADITPAENEKDSCVRMAVTVNEAETLMSDGEAKRLQSESCDYEDTEIYHGSKKAEVNIDIISQMFSDGDTVTLNSLKEKKIIPYNVGHVKILARGAIDKRMTVVAQDFSRTAVKMILLTGGKAIVTYPSSERLGKIKR